MVVISQIGAVEVHKRPTEGFEVSMYGPAGLIYRSTHTLEEMDDIVTDAKRVMEGSLPYMVVGDDTE